MSTIGAYGAIPFEFPVAAISADFAIPLAVTVTTVAADLTPVSPPSVIAIIFARFANVTMLRVVHPLHGFFKRHHHFIILLNMFSKILTHP